MSALALGALSASGEPRPPSAEPGTNLRLNGAWEAGENRVYTRTVPVPGLAQDPTKPSPGTLWYRRTLVLPQGSWTRATLVLNGARFAPAVFVDGQPVSASEGGMAPTEHLLASPAIAPGQSVQLEVALQSLTDVDPLDASATPPADRWRSNVSSGLWDEVTLHLSGNIRIARMTPWTDFARRSVQVRWELDPAGSAPGTRQVQAFIVDAAGHEIARSEPADGAANTGECRIDLGETCQPWSPTTPNVYTLRLVVTAGGEVQDRQESAWGLRDFRTNERGFLLNGNPVQLRAGTIVWHRFVRDPEARTLAFDPGWFERHIVERLRQSGANTLRFHLGLPPEALLDLCDRAGLMVQLEWSFFHGVGASEASMRTQWRSWLDVALRHPSVVLLHPWNETQGEQLERARRSLDALTPAYPPLVISHRDVIHLHKYWWSLFENLGLYYDSASEFSQPIVADEFGGNYLDGDGNSGAYPTVAEAFLRFLGRDHTREMRLRHQAEANGRVAEYWRQIGAAGFSPFCILGSPNDGNHWFLGPLADPQPKPVWAALSAAYAPQSVSLAVWNRNFSPGQKVELPLFFFNEERTPRQLDAAVRIIADDGSERIVAEQKVTVSVPAHGTVTKPVRLEMPDRAGAWRFEAELLTAVPGVSEPIKSAWRCRTLNLTVPAELQTAVIGVSHEEKELVPWLARHGFEVVGLQDERAQILLGSTSTWQRLVAEPTVRQDLAAAIDRGCSVVLLDIGPNDLGRYQAEARANHDGPPKGGTVPPEKLTLFSGVEVTFRQAPEPESHLHPAVGEEALWRSLPREATWLWNGLRGGVIVPATEMDVTGLSAAAFTAQWTSRGADRATLTGGGPLFAYQLGGYYAFSPSPQDEATIAPLRAKVKFLLEDAPSLQGRINPEGPIEVTDLARALRATGGANGATELKALANCGKNLTRVPVVRVEFGAGKGRLVLSQLLTAGRLRPDEHPLALYELGHDPAAGQLVLNMMAAAAPAPTVPETAPTTTTPEYRNFYGITWVGTPHENLTYARQMGYDYVFYQPGMELDPLSDGLSFYFETPEYAVYPRKIDRRKTYPAEEIRFFETHCALMDATAPFPDSIARGWFMGPDVFTPQLDWQQQKVVTWAVDRILEHMRAIQARNPKFRFGGFAWDVPQPAGDFWDAPKRPGRQITLAHWTGGDFGRRHPEVTHEFPTYSDGRLAYYKQLYQATRTEFPHARFLMEPYRIFDDWIKVVQDRPDAREVTPDMLLQERFGPEFATDGRIFASGLITPAHVGSTTPDRFGDADNRLYAASAALGGSWFSWYGRFGGTGDMPKFRHITELPPRLKLIRVLANWENLHGTPLARRTWDGTTYRSPTAGASPDVIYARQPRTGKLFVVFQSLNGRVVLPPYTAIQAIRATNDLFVETGDATGDFLVVDNVITPKSAAAIDAGYIVELRDHSPNSPTDQAD